MTTHRATFLRRLDGGPAVAALCTGQLAREIRAPDGVSLTDKVNCAACIELLAWVDGDALVRFGNEPTLHWPSRR